MTDKMISVSMQGDSISSFITSFNDNDAGNYFFGNHRGGFEKGLTKLLPFTDSPR